MKSLLDEGNEISPEEISARSPGAEGAFSRQRRRRKNLNLIRTAEYESEKCRRPAKIKMPDIQ